MTRLIAYIGLTIATIVALSWRVFESHAPPLFWVPLLLLVVLTGSEIIVFRRTNPIPVAILAIVIPLVGALSYREFFQLTDFDTYFEESYAGMLAYGGRWDPTLGGNYYGYYPAVHLILSTWSMVSDVQLLFLVKYVAPVVIAVVMFAASYFMAKRVLWTGNPTVATLVYVASVGFMAIYPSRRAIALILGIVILALLYCRTEGFMYPRTRSIIVTILFIALALSDHFISLVVLASALVVGTVLMLWKSEPMDHLILPIFLGAVFFGGWWIFVATRVFGLDVMNLRLFLAELYALEVTNADPTSMYGYASLEQYLVLASWGVTVLLSLGGFISGLRGRLDIRSWTWGALGLAMFGFSTLVALHPIYHVIANTVVWFATLLICGIASWTIIKIARLPRLRSGRILSVVLLMLLFSGSLLSVYGARVLDRSPDDSRVIEEIRGFSSEQLTLGGWLKAYSGSNVTILSDKGTYVLLSNTYDLQFVRDFSWPGRASTQRIAEAGFVVKCECYFTLESAMWNSTSPGLVQNLGALNRLWDGGTWQILQVSSR